jgi:hypothetical protein
MSRNVAEEADQGWIWGSSRGGGGAPLKNKDGTPLTNLKLVINGAVEADHSTPDRSFGSGSKTSRRGYNDDDNYDYDDRDRRGSRGGGGGRGGYREDDDYYGGRGGDRRRDDGYDKYDNRNDNDNSFRGSGGRKKIAFRDEYDDEHNRAPRSGGGGRGGRGGRDDDRFNDRDSYGGGRGNNRSRTLPDYHQHQKRSGGRGPDHIPGLSPQGSPKKFMGSIKEMNSSQDPNEVAAKKKKETDYQRQLRIQIEEKQYKKDLDAHKDATLKQKELEEYLAVHYKGQIPPHVTQKVRKTKKELMDKEADLEYRKRKIENGGDDEGIAPPNKSFSHDDSPPRRGGGGGGRKPMFDDFSDDDDFGNRNRGHGPRGGTRDDPNDYNNAPRGLPMNRSGRGHYDDEEDFGSGGGPPMGPRGGHPSDRHQDGGGSGGKKWVSQTEYDELSALCDNLLQKQDELESKLEKKGAPVAGVAAKKRPLVKGVGPDGRVQPRAKSQQQLHREKPQQAAFGSSRPKSNQSVGRTASAKAAPVPKVAFGRKIVESSQATNAQKKTIKTGGVATGRMLMNARGGGGGGNHDDDYGSPPLAPRGGGVRNSPAPRGGGGGGFRALQANNGPVIVNYDDDLGGSNNTRNSGGRGRRGGDNARRSAELDGNSEYLRIGGEEVDLISGDQLDRLLSKARKGRGA